MTSPPHLRGYVTEQRLGRGASAEVWQARVVASGARVALKRIALRDADHLGRAQSEAALLAALDHPNLIRVHALIPDGDAAVLVLDLADGGSLADLLASRGRLTPGEVITALAPIAAALQYVHDEAVLHGDVSPANILFTTAGVALLSDVGAARLTGDDADAESTPAYVDPAVAAGCIPGPQSDVFMLGAVALHALTGAPPWQGDTADVVLGRAASGVLDDIAQRLAGAGVPPSMAAVVERALAVDPQRRGTAADLALDLAHSGEPVAVELAAGRLRSETVTARPAARHAAAETAPPSPPPTRMVGPRPRPVIPRPTARRRILSWSPLRWAAAIAAVAAMTAAALLLHPWSRADRPPAPRPAAAMWTTQLRQLDAVREQAFAERRPALLRGVYVQGPLLHADADLLQRIVPDGCGLAGVHTTYAKVRSSAAAGRTLVTAVARLSSSRLVCGGRLRARAPGRAAMRLQIVLVRTSGGVRIFAERQLPGT
jgi:hypothetical protein